MVVRRRVVRRRCLALAVHRVQLSVHRVLGLAKVEVCSEKGGEKGDEGFVRKGVSIGRTVVVGK